MNKEEIKKLDNRNLVGQLISHAHTFGDMVKNTQDFADEILCRLEQRVMPKIAEVEESITYIKQSQNRIVIEGDEGYSDGYWTMIIYDPLGDEKFKYTITDQASDNDYSFADFLIEAIAKYKESNFSA